MEKKKILMISDSVLSFSGVGLQSRFVAEALVKSGKYKVFNLAGAIKHTDYKPIKTNEYGDDLIIQPVDGYGNPEILRSLVRGWKPDAIWFMTDPRFFEWLWQMEDEIRPLCPLVYYTIWDAPPNPYYNRVWYDSTDHLVAISKVTHEIIKAVAPDSDHDYLPHAVNTEIFKSLGNDVVAKLREDNFKGSKDKTIFFFNSRNARRKMTGSLVWWFKTFLDKVGQDKAMLVMHTNPKDENGPDLDRLAKDRGLTKDQILFSTDKVDFPQLAALYNMADCTINISDAEGFGISCLESLACETPAIVTMTGGLQEQITDGSEFFGVGIEPVSKAIIGSQQVPYIFEDRICEKDFVDALEKIHNMSPSEREELGRKGRQHVLKNYNFEEFGEKWVNLMDRVVEKHGSWDTRKGYKTWECKEIK